MPKINSRQTIIKGAKIYAENKVLRNSQITINEERISDIGPIEENTNKEVISLPENWHVIPGMIDMHIHGAAGADTMDATPEALSTISKALLQEGTTAFLPTIISESNTAIEQALKNTAEFIDDKNRNKETTQKPSAQILGINVEGPFLCKQKSGAQQKKYITNPNIELFEQWIKHSDNNIKIVTIAPEINGGLEFISFLKSKKIIASIGHTHANFNETNDAIAAGISHATHLYNAMSEMQHRDPNAVGAVLTSDSVVAELIADKIHVHPAILQLTFLAKKADKLILVTDGIRAKYLPDGNYSIGTQSVVVDQQIARLPDGTLAGSTLKMCDAARNMLTSTSCRMFDIIKMTAENPAKQLGIFAERGSMTAGKLADIVVLDENYNLMMTICRGKVGWSHAW